jgi:hypothetical protein
MMTSSGTTLHRGRSANMAGLRDDIVMWVWTR